MSKQELVGRRALLIAAGFAFVLVAALVLAANLTSAHADSGSCRAILCAPDGCYEPACNDKLLLYDWTILLAGMGMIAALVAGSVTRPGTLTRVAVVVALCILLGVEIYGSEYQVYWFEALPGHDFPHGWIQLVVVIGAGALVNRWWVALVGLVVPLLTLPLGTDAEGQAEWVLALVAIPILGVLLAFGVAVARLAERIRHNAKRPLPAQATV